MEITPKTNAENTYDGILRKLEVCRVAEREKREMISMVDAVGNYCVSDEKKRQFRNHVMESDPYRRDGEKEDWE